MHNYLQQLPIKRAIGEILKALRSNAFKISLDLVLKPNQEMA